MTGVIAEARRQRQDIETVYGEIVVAVSDWRRPKLKSRMIAFAVACAHVQVFSQYPQGSATAGEITADSSASNRSASNCCAVETDDSVQLSRIESARFLTERAKKLTELTNALERWTIAESRIPFVKEQPQVDAEKGGVEESVNLKKQSAESFQDLFQAYQTARRQYLQHKLLYDEHVAVFHRQATQSQAQYQVVAPSQTQSSSTDIMPMPQPYSKIRLRAEDACNALQQTEFALYSAEQTLVLAINYAAKIRGKVTDQVYADAWNSAQTQGSNLQRQVVDFGRDVLNKEQASNDQLHQATQIAQRDGDFVQAKKTYMEVQRSSALNQEETNRAHKHSMFLAAALNAIRVLNPLSNPNANSVAAATSAQSGASPIITNDQIQNESNALEREYNQLQEQYSAMEKANPANRR